ncbi:protein ANTAGONIST OF LIKE HETEROCHROMATIN PROTEIN 1-like [Ischnura elegans]|uniref:protein ANTAGONIST OF LIKE HETEROCHROMATIN PROTEIN 1-like n=1 Tax=Ischnura elegans TaxID=197161 RepID=UPI001ED87B6E|nr:protein ANTAGONIST OF LIKE HETEROCHROMATIN PROTEIN 1-like [Ischnura elegans]
MEHLLGLVGPIINEKEGPGRMTITPEKQLAIAIWYLGTPDSYRSVSNTFGIGRATAFRAVRRVCHALHILALPLVSWPRGDAAAQEVIAGFHQESGFPGIPGAIE